MKRTILIVALLLSAFAWAQGSQVPEPGKAPKEEKAKVQCRAVTKSGNRCKRRAAPGSHYCRQHSSDVKPKKPASRCRAMKDDGSQCEAKPVEGRNYCEKHLDNGANNQ